MFYNVYFQNKNQDKLREGQKIGAWNDPDMACLFFAKNNKMRSIPDHSGQSRDNRRSGKGSDDNLVYLVGTFDHVKRFANSHTRTQSDPAKRTSYCNRPRSFGFVLKVF